MSQVEEVGFRRRHNKAVILHAIRRVAPVSRTRIRERTGMRMASITELVRELVRDGLVRESGAYARPAERGRRQVGLRLNPDYGYVVGVEFDAERVFGLAMDFEARVLSGTKVNLVFGRDKDEGLRNIRAAIRQVMERAECAVEAGAVHDPGDSAKSSGSPALLGIGVADPGVVDAERGVSLLSSTIDGWKDVPLREMIQESFRVPVCLEEDTRSRLIAEKECGDTAKADHVMFVEFGRGIGCSVTTPAGPYRGSSGSSGELGHTFVAENGPVCRCGSYGCLESVASTPAIANRARRAIREGAGSTVRDLAGNDTDAITAEHVFEAARAGDKLAVAIMDETARCLGIAIANAVNLFNPELIIFDARLGRLEDLLLEPVIRTIRKQALEVSTRNLRFAVSKLGEEGGAMGVAFLALDRLFDIPRLSVPAFTANRPSLP